MRAAEAAKNTTDLIEGIIKTVKEGSELADATDESVVEAAKSTDDVGELIDKITAASNEQAVEIEQVNKAVVEIDKVVQQNAANAEESASASEEMKAQAEQMKGFVDELVTLVGASAGAAKKASQFQAAAPKGVTTTRALAVSEKRAATKEVAVHKAKEVTPEQVIPLEDGDFKDF